MPAINIQDLVVVEVDSKHLTNEIREWKKNNPVFPIESCTTQVWLLNKDQLKTCPIPRDDPAFEWRTGSKAYAYFLQLTAGLDSTAEGECNIVGQVKDAWRQFSLKWPEQSKDLENVFQNVITDAALVRNAVTQDVLPARYETSARKLAHMTGGERVLVIIDANQLHHNNNQTTKVLKSIGGTRSRDESKRPEAIIITHPSDEVLGDYKSVVDGLEENGVIRVPVIFKSFNECIDEDLPRVDRIFLCNQYAGKNKPVTDQIVKKWERNRKEGSLIIHTQGMPVNHDFGGDTDRFITDGDIRSKLKSQSDHNKMRKQQGLDACENCAFSRAHNKKPLGSFVHLLPFQYMQRTSMSVYSSREC